MRLKSIWCADERENNSKPNIKQVLNVGLFFVFVCMCVSDRKKKLNDRLQQNHNCCLFNKRKKNPIQFRSFIIVLNSISFCESIFHFFFYFFQLILFSPFPLFVIGHWDWEKRILSYKSFCCCCRCFGMWFWINSREDVYVCVWWRKLSTKLQTYRHWMK